MSNPLIPELAGRQLTVDTALASPLILRNRIGELAAKDLLLGKLFRPAAGRVTGGGMLYSTLAASDLVVAGNLEKRTPGAEYALVEGVDPDPKLALVEDWGGRFIVTEEQISRNDVNYLDQQVTQLANTIARKLDTRAAEVLAATTIGSVAADVPWDDVITRGADEDLTASADLPTSHFALAQELSDLEEMGITHDTLLVHPGQARALRTAYAGGELTKVLESAGLTMVTNPRLTDGVAYLVQAGQVGTVGFEYELTVRTWPIHETRSTGVLAFCVPAFAIDRPYAAKKLTALAAA